MKREDEEVRHPNFAVLQFSSLTPCQFRKYLIENGWDITQLGLKETESFETETTMSDGKDDALVGAVIVESA